MDKNVLKNKLTDLTNAYKVVGTLSVLAVAQKDIETIKEQYKILKEIFSEIVEVVEKNCSKKEVEMVKNLDIDNLPEYLKPISTVDIYNKILALKYTNIEIEDYEDKIEINKMSVELNHIEEMAYLNIARTLYEQKKYVEAIRLCEYIKTLATTAPVYEILGDVYRDLKYYDESIASYKRYLELNENDTDAKARLDEIYEEALANG